MMAEAGCRALNITNIDPRVDDRLLSQILSQAGRITHLRIVPDHNYTYGGLSTGFVEFADHQAADAAMTTLNGQQIYDTAITLSWALNSSANAKREDTSQHIHLWVGDIAPEVDDTQLRQAFGVFGSMSDARVMWDPNSGKSRGYGFVSFREKLDAERALNQMNGQMLGSKRIRCNWAHQRNSIHTTQTSSTASGAYSSAAAFIQPTRPSMNFNYVVSQTNANHTTIYVGNVPPNCSVDMLQPVFRPYGFVMDIKCTPERGFAFVKMDSHDNAATAICYVNGLLLNGSKLKCSWGRERTTDSMGSTTVYNSGAAAVPTGQYGAGAAATAANPYYAYAGYAPQGGYPAGYEQYYNQYNQYYAQYYAQAAAGYDPSMLQQQQPQQGNAEGNGGEINNN